MKGLDNRRVRAVFDSASNSMLVLRKVVERGALSIEEMPDKSQCILGVGGRTNSTVAKLTIEKEDGQVNII